MNFTLILFPRNRTLIRKFSWDRTFEHEHLALLLNL